MITLYNEFLEKDGKKIKKVYLNYIDAKEENRHQCDCCDEFKPLASINTLSGTDVICICKDCLQLIINEFNKEV